MKELISNITDRIKLNLSAYRYDRAGVAAVEFALVVGAFMALILGTLEMGRLLFTWNALQYTVERILERLTTEDLKKRMPPIIYIPHDDRRQLLNWLNSKLNQSAE